MKKPIPHFPFRPVTWFVLANRAEAVIYGDKKNQPFYFIQRLNNRIGKAPEFHLIADREGTVGSSATHSIRHSFEKKESKHEHQAKLFAKRIATFLEKEKLKRRYDQLVIAAEPHFLGLLRAALKPSLRALVQHEVRHAYLQGSDAELRHLVLNAIPRREGRLNL